MAGEEAHDIGRDGLQRAKHWLDMSTRVKRSWKYDDPQLASLLHFPWPHGRSKSFSFDLGGTFQGDALENQSFLAEIKKYKSESNLPTHYLHFLAKCYVALGAKPELCNNFLWISWSPFQAKDWDKHATPDKVRASLLHNANRKRVFGVDNVADAELKLDAERVADVARRIWLITLCDKQEQLVLREGHFYQVRMLIDKEGGTGW
jgi:hypothetical protein